MTMIASGAGSGRRRAETGVELRLRSSVICADLYIKGVISRVAPDIRPFFMSGIRPDTQFRLSG